MSEPQPLPDRIVFLSHADYVRLKDDHPELLSDTRAAVIPYPLIGRWIAYDELRACPAGPAEVLLRDPISGKGYLPAEAALRTLSLAQAHTFNRVCQLLGSTTLKVVESDTRVDKSRLSNEFTAGVKASAQVGVESNQGLSANLDVDLNRELRRCIETSGSWQGGEPDVTAARAAAAVFQDVTGAVATLIDMRASDTNQLRSYRVHVDFLSEVHRQVDLIIDLARSLRLALGEAGSAGLEAMLRNQFRWSTDHRRHETFSVEVWFADPAETSSVV